MPSALFSLKAQLLSCLSKETKIKPTVKSKHRGWGHNGSIINFLFPWGIVSSFYLQLALLHKAKTCPAMLNSLQRRLAEPLTAMSLLTSALPYPLPSPTSLKLQRRAVQEPGTLPLCATGGVFIRHDSFPKRKSRNISLKLKKTGKLFVAPKTKHVPINLFSIFLPEP